MSRNSCPWLSASPAWARHPAESPGGTASSSHSPASPNSSSTRWSLLLPTGSSTRTRSQRGKSRRGRRRVVNSTWLSVTARTCPEIVGRSAPPISTVTAAFVPDLKRHGWQDRRAVDAVIHHEHWSLHAPIGAEDTLLPTIRAVGGTRRGSDVKLRERACRWSRCV